MDRPLVALALVVAPSIGCGGAIWDQRPGAFNDALTSKQLEVGKIPTDFGASQRNDPDTDLGPDTPMNGTKADGSAGNDAFFISYDEKTRRICFDRANAHDLIDDADIKKYFAKEKRPNTYVVDVWESLENLSQLPFPPHGFGATPVEVTPKDGGAIGNKYALNSAGTGVVRTQIASVWAYVKICGVLSEPLKPGRFVTLSRAEMKQPGFEVDNIPSEVFVWKVTDEKEGQIGLGAAPRADAPSTSTPSGDGEEPPPDAPTEE